MKTPLLWCVVLQIFTSASSDNSYFVLSPKLIRPGQTLSVFVRIYEATGPVSINIGIDNAANETVTDVTKTVFMGRHSILNLQIPVDLFGGSYTLRSEGSGGLKFSERMGLTYSAKSSSIFIQTDKAVYRPGERVLMKAVGTYSDLRLVNAPMDITIFDSQNNRIKQWLSFSDDTSSVFQGELQLTKYTNTGDWRVSVKQLTTEQDKVFEVREFVLPRYEVTLTLPPFGLTSDEYLTGKVTATYTFGKAVRGELVVGLDRRGRTDDRIELRFKNFNGEMEFKVLTSDVIAKLGRYVLVDATVVEGLTGDEVTDNGDIQLYDVQEKLSFAESLPQVFKPGLPYNVIIRVTQPDDTPLPGAKGQVEINIEYQVLNSPQPTDPEESRIAPIPFPQTGTKSLPTIFKAIPRSGILEFQFTVPSEAESANIRANFKNASTSLYLRRARSPSDSYLQLALLTKASKLTVGKRAVFKLTSTEKMSVIEYQILSKTTLVDSGSVNGQMKKSRKFSVTLTQAMPPRATLVVFYVRADGEVVPDSISFTVQGLFENKVSLKFNKKKVVPNTKIKLKLKAEPQSEMHVLAVDKKVLLLKTGNDITQTDVMSEIQLYTDSPIDITPFRWWWWFPIPVDGKDAYTIFQRAGVVVLTDLTIYRQQEPFFQILRLNDMEGSGPNTVTTNARIRRKFPETWIWTSITARSNGKATLTRKTPDSITTWVASMFAANDKSGLGVAPSTAELTVFMNEFLEIIVPQSVIRGEIIVIQVNVFNFGNNDLNAVIILKKTKNFFFSDANGEQFTPDNPAFPKAWAKSITVGVDEVDAVYFPIVPLQIGDVDLTVLAKEETNKGFKDIDAIRKPIKIRAEGVRQSYSIPTLKTLEDGETITDQLTVTFPENHVSGSEYIQVSVIGDIMGPALSGIEDLLQMSYGCGEQNLLNFVPNVFITGYLSATNRLTPDIRGKAESFLTAGYQRELIFRHTDGSFSAFGNSDPSGSTWLTAFVVKAFVQAGDDIFIDPDIIASAIRFLLHQQNEDGSFQEPGMVLHKELQGGSIASKRSLTAFVMIALEEARQRDFVPASMSGDVDKTIEDAIDYIIDGGIGSFQNTYELGIAVYALTLASTDSSTLDAIFAELENLATVENGMKYWILPDDEAEAVSPYKSWRPPTTRSRALDIEVTAYVMLAYVSNNDIVNALPVLKWLITQQNPNGGFASTQDTVVALQALAAIAELVYSDDFGIAITVQSTPGSFSHSFTISNTNSLVLQIAEIPYVQNTQNLTVTATGSGICLLEVSVYFNVEEELRVPAFNMTIALTGETLEGFRLDICFRWLRDGRSTMVLLDVVFPTGMSGDIKSIDTTRAPLYKRAEPSGDNVDMYFDYADDKEACVAISVFRHSLAVNPKKVPITITDYYETANTLTEFYSSQLLSDTSLEDVCRDRNCF